MIHPVKHHCLVLLLALVWILSIPPLFAEKWSFGVIADTQQSPFNNRNGSVAVDIIDAINRQFIEAKVDLVIQVGDLADYGTTAALDVRAAHQAALKAASIPFYPVRGNHDGRLISARHFLQAFPGLPGTPGNGGSSPQLSGASGHTYSFVHKATKFILLDQFELDDGKGGSVTHTMAGYQPWIDAELSANDHLHAFVLSHKPLLGQAHKDNLFGNPANPNDAGDIHPEMQNAFFASLANHKVRYYLCGHDHKHHHAMVSSPDGKSRVQQIIGASASLFGSYCSYGSKPPFSPREIPLSQEGGQCLGYYIYTVDGPRVSGRLYTVPLAQFNAACRGAEASSAVIPWKSAKTFGYSLNGGDWLVSPGQSLQGLAHAIPPGEGFAGTQCRFLGGVAPDSARTSDKRPCSTLVSVGWAQKKSDENFLCSDVLTVWNTSSQSTPCVLSMNFPPLSPSQPRQDGDPVLLARNENGQWINAAAWNDGIPLRQAQGEYESKSGCALGTYGIDKAHHSVWAVINRGGEFAVGWPMQSAEKKSPQKTMETNANPAGCWPLNEGNGKNIEDLSPNRRNGAIQGNNFFWFKNGGQSALEIMEGSRIDIPASTNLNFTSEFTLMAWINPAGESPDFMSIMAKGGYARNAGYHLVCCKNRLGIYLSTANTRATGGHGLKILTDEPVLKPREWSHAACTYSLSEKKLRLYCNGKIVHESPATQPVAYRHEDIASMPLRLGCMGWLPGWWQFKGFIREVKIFQTALSPRQVEEECLGSQAQFNALQVKHYAQRLAEVSTCKIQAKIIDAKTKQPIEAMVSVMGSDGKSRHPENSFGEAIFCAFGGFDLMTAPGETLITVSRGVDYEVKKINLATRDGETQNLAIELAPLVDMAALGWYSGMHHLHYSQHGGKYIDRMGPSNACLVARADGLNYVNWMDSFGAQAALDSMSTGRFIAHQGIEGGDHSLHGSLVNLYVNSLQGDYWEQMEDAKRQGGISIPTHPYRTKMLEAVRDPAQSTYSRALPIGIALNMTPVYDLYCGDGDMKERIRDWYRFLNLGFKVGATGSPDWDVACSGKLAGGARTYVKLPQLSFPEIINALRAGKTFFTNGPLILFTVNGKDAGDTLAFSGTKPERLSCSVKAWLARGGLKKVDVIWNGAVAKTLHSSGGKMDESLDLEIKESGWLAASASGGGFAHTSPIYVQFGNEKIKPKKEDAEYFITWLDNFEKVLPEWEKLQKKMGNPAKIPQRTPELIAQAREIFKSLLAAAEKQGTP
ncbi:MAG: CehA/McbA family metallohydrolase [Verrucomicrobiae bacterium]|nr:CehA/McbA family metallohydrolase [Verrucomicrobiae bacterium]